MLFKVRAINAPKEERPKNQMTIADILAFRDTWQQPPCEGFSVAAILHRVHAERQKRAEVPKLVMSENGFRVRSKEQMAESERELRRVQSTLNKLTEQNFDAVVREMLSHELIFDPAVLSGAVNIIFTKAVAEPVFSGLYARLCARIANYEKELISEAAEHPDSELGQRVRVAKEHLEQLTQEERAWYGNMGDFVRVALILRCQAFHEQFVQQDHPKDEEAEERLRKQNMANIKFVGELYMKALVTNKVMLIICSTALGLGLVAGSAKTTVSDVDVEMVISLMNVLGKRFDDTTSQPMRDEIWDALKRCVDDRRFSMRIRFLLQNLLDWRNSGWKPREGTTTTTTSSSSQGDAASPSTANTTATAGGSGGGGAPHRLSSSGSSASLQWPPAGAESGGGGAGGGRMGNTPLSGIGTGGMHYKRGMGGGGGGGSRVSSYNDLGMYSSGQHGAAGGQLPPPPPFPHALAAQQQQHALPPPPPFPHAQQQSRFPAPQAAQPHYAGPTGAAAPSDEDKQLLATAQPPRSLTSEVEGKLLSIMRDADVDADWAAADALVLAALPGEAAHVSRACAVYALCKRAVLANVAADRDVFARVLHGGVGGVCDATVLAHGYTWALVDVIVHALQEDCPLAYTRFASLVAATHALDVAQMLCELLMRTANYLDVHCVTRRLQRASAGASDDHNNNDDDDAQDDEEDEDSWQVAFVDVCASVLSQWAQARGGGDGHDEVALLDAMAAVPQRAFMRDVAPDFLMELVQHGCLHEAAIATWLATHGHGELVQQLQQLFPDLATA